MIMNPEIECPLTACAAGDEAEILELAIDSGLAARLRELGLVAGSALRVVSAGSPMILEIGETRFCLRGAEADGIFVRVGQPGFAAAPFPSALEEADLA
ncbi:MAG TPA: FeoA domain-containing protein [Candidatus Hydrogenedentes bacterium]|nr:FeoA domain-containing protein [Candidatus Hydrogenedentota bacterium]HRK36691.1 FeoA domain-containing protein [Candidatus Hydrogenedentota bacterium]